VARSRQATLARTKTDTLDVRCLARFCAAHALHPWAPPSAAHQRLRVPVATRQTLLAQAHQRRNRQPAAGSTAYPELLRELQAPVLAAMAAQLARLDRELAALAAADTPIGTQPRLLSAVPGLGLVTAATLVASLPVERLPTAKHAAASAVPSPSRLSWQCARTQTSAPPLSASRLRASRPRWSSSPSCARLLLAWTRRRTGRPFVATAPSHSPERANDAALPCSPVPAPATTQPAGT
jgi:hypothetical protein